MLSLDWRKKLRTSSLDHRLECSYKKKKSVQIDIQHAAFVQPDLWANYSYHFYTFGDF